MKFCTEQSSITAMICADIQKDSPINKEAMDKQDFVQFQLKTNFKHIVHIVMAPGKTKG